MICRTSSPVVAFMQSFSATVYDKFINIPQKSMTDWFWVESVANEYTDSFLRYPTNVL